MNLIILKFIRNLENKGENKMDIKIIIVSVVCSACFVCFMIWIKKYLIEKKKKDRDSLALIFYDRFPDIHLNAYRTAKTDESKRLIIEDSKLRFTALLEDHGWTIDDFNCSDDAKNYLKNIVFV